MTIQSGLVVSEKLLKKRQPFFYVCAMVVFFGLIYMIIIPPCEAPDEPAHFARAYGIAAEGQLVLKDHPRELLEFAQENMQRHDDFHEFITNILQKDKDRFKNLAFNTALYSPFPYIFHATGIKIVSLISNSVSNLSACFYFARLISLALFIGVVLWMYTYPYNLKWIVFWIFTNPMALAQSCTINLDVVIFCASILILLSSIYIEKKYSFLLVIIAGFFLMLSKPVYTPILILPLITILIKNVDKKNFKLLGLLISYAFIFLSGVAWGVVSRKYGILDHYIEASGSVKLNPNGQLLHALTSPLDFFQIIINTFIQNGLQTYHQFVGVLAWLDVPIPTWTIILWGIFAIIILFLADSHNLKFTKKQTKWLGFAFISIAFICFLLVMLSGYMLWTPVSSNTIPLQGRYFHAVLATLLLGFILIRPQLKIRYELRRFMEWSLVAACLIIHSSTTYTLLDKFWL